MKLKVPFYKQTTSLNCGPTVLKIALAFLDKEYSIKQLEKQVGIKDKKGVSTIKLATAAASLGYKVDFFSKHILFDEKNLDLNFYKNHGDLDLEESRKQVKIAEKAGVNIREKTLNLEELLSNLTKTSIPIVLIDWNIIIKKQESYQGHFVPIVGYDDKYIYIHNSGLRNPQKFMQIKKDIFEKSRKAKGTDEDILIIYKK